MCIKVKIPTDCLFFVAALGRIDGSKIPMRRRRAAFDHDTGVVAETRWSTYLQGGAPQL